MNFDPRSKRLNPKFQIRSSDRPNPKPKGLKAFKFKLPLVISIQPYFKSVIHENFTRIHNTLWIQCPLDGIHCVQTNITVFIFQIFPFTDSNTVFTRT